MIQVALIHSTGTQSPTPTVIVRHLLDTLFVPCLTSCVISYDELCVTSFRISDVQHHLVFASEFSLSSSFSVDVCTATYVRVNENPNQRFISFHIISYRKELSINSTQREVFHQNSDCNTDRTNTTEFRIVITTFNLLCIDLPNDRQFQA